MNGFREAYAQLNTEQKRAVDALDGPMLVIAGPGTGKTQLLSARVANILDKTDTLPQNILCLTFTETGAANMRERLARFIGQAAYDVQIGTYHAFGGDLIKRYPEYFPDLTLFSPVDELGQFEILQQLVNKMSYQNPLKQTQYHINDLISTVSEVKRALLTPDDLTAIADENLHFINNASQISIDVLGGLKSTASFKITYPKFELLHQKIQKLTPKKEVNERFGSLAVTASRELELALQQAQETSKTSAITKWKNSWLVKNGDNGFVFDGELQNMRLMALAEVCGKYDKALKRRNLYDFDDMILKSIEALQTYDNFRFTLQERYQYLLLDEYQDTNAAQAKLIWLLTDNPVNEGRPNVMAVGDDDQAIYAFQGAQYSNMLDFYNQYRDVTVINLRDNYRSHPDILETAHNLAAQVAERLHHSFDGMTKTLSAKSVHRQSSIQRTEFLSDISQYSWISETIQKLIHSGTNPNEIAVLAPRHKYLEPLVGYLNEKTVPVRYEKRENILETAIIQEIVHIVRLLEAIRTHDSRASNALWPQVLSYEFWDIPISLVWQLSWQANDGKQQWNEILLDHEVTRPIALLLLTLAARSESDTCEAILDCIIGTEEVKTGETDNPTVRSPLRSFYTNEKLQQDNPELFYDTLSHLTVLREKLRDRQFAQGTPLQITDLLELVDLYEAAGQRMLDTSPYSQAADAVQLMTVYKAKGLEFEHVFVINCHDDVWGATSRTAANRITLPANLQPIRKSGTNDDERLRILFVAITRAKFGLQLTSFRHSFSGRLTRPLKYLDEQDQDDGSRLSNVLPDHCQKIVFDDFDRPALEALTTNWQQRHLNTLPDTQLKQLLQNRIETYQLSPTHLNQFTDLIYGGPQKFFMNTILRFPQAPTISSQYGSVMHDTLDWIQRQTTETGAVPSTVSALEYFATVMAKANLTKKQIELETDRGQHSLKAYLDKRRDIFKPQNISEYNFRNEGVFVNNVHMGGKIDLLEINTKDKTICVVDYKTGSGYAKWKDDAKLHKYRQQLFAYKLLVEGSNRFKGYTVTSGRVEFVEPDGQGNLYILPEIVFDDGKEELQRLEQLLSAMWHKVKSLDMPTIDSYSKDLKGIQAFEDDLIKTT